MGGLFVLCEWFMKFTVVNLLWLLFSFPIVLLGFNLFFIEDIKGVLAILILMVVLLPFTFFPATTAMFAMAREWVFKDYEGNPLVKSFWHFYKENYKRSLANGLLGTAIWSIWMIDVYYFYVNHYYLFLTFLTMGIVLFVLTINLFSVTVHFKMSIWKSLKSAFFITIGGPVLFLAIAISSGIVIYMSFNMFLFLIPFLTGSLIAFLSFSAFYSRYIKLIDGMHDSENRNNNGCI